MFMLYDMHWRAAKRSRAFRLSAASKDIFTPALVGPIAGRNYNKADGIEALVCEVF